MEEKWRQELKYAMTEAESAMTARRLSAFMRRDIHTGGRREYFIRSLYFDNQDDKVLKEKLSGAAVREKFRIRYYDFDLRLIRLEKKSKRHSLGHKYQCPLEPEEVEKIILGETGWMAGDGRPLVRELWLKMRLEQLRPCVLVDYRREPLTFAPGNVRVTFDRDIRASKNIRGFFRRDTPTVPVLDGGRCIMEVKYDDFLPDVVSRTLLTVKNREQSFSKYAACRING